MGSLTFKFVYFIDWEKRDDRGRPPPVRRDDQGLFGCPDYLRPRDHPGDYGGPSDRPGEGKYNLIVLAWAYFVHRGKKFHAKIL